MKYLLRNFKKILLILIILILLFPTFQKTFKIIRVDWLKGAIEQTEKKYFALKDWFTGEYQIHEEKYLNENFGFRNAFIRFNNEISFDLFCKAKANGVIIGKQNYLFEENYIKSYLGTDFIGKDSIEKRITRLKFLQDTLKKINKNLIVIFAAGKGFYYPEFIPDKYKVQNKITNYAYHIKLADQLKLDYIDFNDYFIKNKSKSKYPLYPQYGIHWSIYGMCLAADSIIHFIENKRNIDMANIYWNKVDFEDPKNEDYDIADGMNLIFRLKSFKMGYPRLKYESDKNKVKPNILVVSDSYYWGMFNFGISNVFNQSHFWYYNKEIYPETFTKPLFTSQVNIKKEINKHDVILIMSTPATMTDMGWGVIEKMYDAYSIK